MAPEPISVPAPAVVAGVQTPSRVKGLAARAGFPPFDRNSAVAASEVFTTQLEAELDFTTVRAGLPAVRSKVSMELPLLISVSR